jgi:amidase
VASTTALPHDHQPDVDAGRITVNGQPRPYGDQIPWASLAGLCGLPAVVLPAASPTGSPSASRSSDFDSKTGPRSTSRPESQP